MVHTEATGRAAVTGNPADVYLENALVLAYSIKNKASISIESSDKLKITSSDNIDPTHRLAYQTLKHFKIKDPLKIHYTSNIPFNSGLGGSAAILVALTAALNKKSNLNLSLLDITKHSLEIEHELDIKAGWQDRAAATFGSSLINCKNFTCKTLSHLPKNLYVAYYGKEKSSGYVHQKGLEKSSSSEFMSLMQKTISLTKEAHKAIEFQDWDTLGPLMNQNWDVREQTLGLTKKDQEIKDLIFENKGFANQTGSGGAALVLDLDGTLKPILKEKNIKILDLTLNGGLRLK